MYTRKKKTPFEREWEDLCRKEQHFLHKRQQKKEPALNRMLEQKVPPKLQQTLELAFEKAFALVFEKGTGMIEKTYPKDRLEKEYLINRYADEIHANRRSLSVFSKKAQATGRQNTALSGLSGIGMGALGIGIPDIPVFTAIALKCIYEIAVRYGFSYTDPEERYFILLLLEGAVSYGESLRQTDEKTEAFLRHPRLPEGYCSKQQIARTSAQFSKELLYLKFLQGIPLVGAVGGAYDMLYMNQISQYANLKYRKRFLLRYRQNHGFETANPQTDTTTEG